MLVDGVDRGSAGSLTVVSMKNDWKTVFQN